MKLRLKNKYCYIFSWIPSIIIMIIIFLFSASPAEESQNTSSELAQKVVYVIEVVTDEKIEEESSLYDTIHFLVRKTGHFLEYMALGCTFVLPYSLIIRKKWLVLLFSEFSAAVYACTDEFHQLFVEGRDGNFRDVMIDSTGALVGICFGFVVWFMIYKIEKKSK